MGNGRGLQRTVRQCSAILEEDKKKSQAGDAAGSCLATCALSRLLCVLCAAWLACCYLQVAAIPRGTIRQWLHRQI